MVFSVTFFIAAALWVRSGGEHRPLAGASSPPFARSGS